MIRVKLAQKYGSFFPGETGGFPDEIGERLIAERKGRRVLDDDSVEPWPEVEASDGTDANEPDGLKVLTSSEHKFNAETDLFMADGLDESIAVALHTNGLHTPEQVMTYIASGKALVELADIGKTRAKKIAELYGQ
jgi:hypothetical protein